MSVAITALYAGILGLVIVAMGVNVTVHRFKSGVTLGDGGVTVLRRMIRIHGNSIENIPLGLLLMALYELGGGEKNVPHGAGIALSVGRICFAGPLLIHDGRSLIRAIGVSLTWCTIALLAIFNILQSVHSASARSATVRPEATTFEIGSFRL